MYIFALGERVVSIRDFSPAEAGIAAVKNNSVVRERKRIAFERLG